MKLFFQIWRYTSLLLLTGTLQAQTVTSTVNTNCGLDINTIVVHPTCPNGDDGRIELEITTDAADATIDWLELDQGVPVEDAGPEFLNAGLYRVAITDGQGCTDTLNFELSDPPILVNVVLGREDVLCNGEQNGIINLLPDNPSKVRRYYLNGQPSANGTADARFENLAPGNYIILIEDINGCFQEDYAEILEPEKLEVDVNKQDVTCPGSTDGYFSLSAIGGVGGYRFSLDGQQFHEDLAYDDLEPAEYTVYVRDNNGCQKSRTFSIKEPPAPEVNFSKEDVTCPGGADASFIVIIETVGLSESEDYDFSLDGLNFQADSVFKELEAGNYEVTVRNPQSCLTNAYITIEEPSEANIEFQKEDVTCPGGADARFIVIIETVGLTNGEDYEFSLNGINYQPDSIFENLNAGAYTLHVRNETACVQTQSIVIEEPNEPLLTFEEEDVTCPGGSDGRFIVIIETVGLTEGEDYDFSLDGIFYQEDSLFQNLTAGVYEVFVRSTAQCIKTAYVIIEEPGEPGIQLQVDPVTCPGAGDGAVRFQVMPIGNYSYSLDGLNFQPTPVFNQLGGGFYEAYIKDANGCTFMASFYIEEAANPDYDIQSTAVSCHGFLDGQIDITLLSGQTPFTFSINGNDYQSEAQFYNLPAGSYQIYLRDERECVFVDSLEISQPELLQNKFISGASTCGYANGWVAAELSGGTAAYQYEWRNGASEAVITELNAGWYSLTIQDQHSCVLKDSVFIENKEGPTLFATTNDASCHEATDGAIDLNIQASVPIRRIIWSTGARTEDIETLKAGHYAVTVVDRNECYSSASYELKAPAELTIAADVQQSGNTGNISLAVSGGTSSYNYQWSTGEEISALYGLSPGDYMVSVTDAQQCMTTATFSLLPTNQELEENILIYPVPTMDELYIRFDLPERQSVEVELLDELGRLLMKSVEGDLINERLTLELGALPAAMYYLRIKVAEESFVHKIVLQKD